ncbi:histone acetyltransferase type B catalytic subunit [Piedraia hortae CBS 480.64]|uniref:Histone acetyltransferase type B catalytic subunit n=1 Tax=Piedraia hortae CBS 480.64 TaxID=1314780 RepID=A0A6A7C4R1_9PEZI|nr:histone acetyltransferase type B catalytic subunit [Piedraia hortae CBS 480.64]
MAMEDDLAAQLSEQIESWSCSSTDCFHISLLRPNGELAAGPFNPKFTYPIFGDEETIFGYRDLDISLTLREDDLYPHLSVKYGEKFKGVAEVQPTDIQDLMKDFLPEKAFQEAVQQSQSFTPPGEKLAEHNHSGKTCETWTCSLADPKAREILENMQIFAPLMIEGGSLLDLTQEYTAERWRLFLYYRVQDGTYSLVGYCTAYILLYLPNSFASGAFSLDDIINNPPADGVEAHYPHRSRLSQFIILPPYQGCGHGRNLYRDVFSNLTAPKAVKEMTVEDPNEAFDDLRDFCDLEYLRNNSPAFADLKINTSLSASNDDSPFPIDQIVDGDTRRTIRVQTKLEERQFDRLVEMQTLSRIPVANREKSRITRKEKCSNPNDRAFYLWRLFVKERLYRFNFDQLSQIEDQERIDRLESAVDSVIEGYEILLEKAESRGKPKGKGNKRVIVEDGSDEEVAKKVKR